MRIKNMASTSGRRQATRQKVFEATVSLIAEQGFAATTVEEIAERAGIAKGTVYYNFASKSELIEELLRHGVGLLTASLETAADETLAGGGTHVDALDAMLGAGLAFIEQYPAVTMLYVSEVWRSTNDWNSALREVRGVAVAAVEKVLRGGVDAGEFDPEIDRALTASALIGTVLVVALDWRTFEPERSLADVHAAMSRLLQGRVATRR